MNTDKPIRCQEMISVIVPVYGCTGSLELLYERLKTSLLGIVDDFEIIMVNDASPDNSWQIIKMLSKKDHRVKGVNFSRNFGQHRAIAAGLDYTIGDWVVVMDCDLQDSPEEIEKLYREAQKGYDAVFGLRYNRNDSFFKKLGSKIFYKIYNYFLGTKIDGSIGNFSIISSKVVKELTRLQEQNHSYLLFIDWLGFNRTAIKIEHTHREEGKSSYTFNTLISLAIDSIISQSNKPLKISIKFGFMISSLSMVYAFYLIIMYLLNDIIVEGWTSVIVSIYFIAGLLFANLGVLGLYIGKIFDEQKKRPLYIVKETLGYEISEKREEK
ncbi:MAG: glycosyltransferase family 2 protein [Bacteroidales bacterium]|nr:glycosyltransferase family 2 protein [Bacteroidales bacterium]